VQGRIKFNNFATVASVKVSNDYRHRQGFDAIISGQLRYNGNDVV